MKMNEADGFTLVELLVAIGLFSVLSIGFYQVLFSGVRGSETTRSVVRISEEARLAFNRMIRDTREATRFSCVGPSSGECIDESSFEVNIDFNGDGLFLNSGEPGAVPGDYERVTFEFDSDAGTINLNGEVLIDGVEQIPGPGGAPRPVFDYSSNLLQYDTSPVDGTATWEEIDASTDPGVGNQDRAINEAELQYLTSVSFAFQVREEDRASEFFAEAQLRNRR